MNDGAAPLLTFYLTCSISAPVSWTPTPYKTHSVLIDQLFGPKWPTAWQLFILCLWHSSVTTKQVLCKYVSW